MLVLREMGLVRTTPDDDEKLVKLRDPDLKEQVRRKTKEILIDDELRRRRCVSLSWGLGAVRACRTGLGR